MTRRDFPGDAGEWTVARLQIEGLHCLSCVLRVETALEDVPDVLSAAVDLADASATVVCRTGSVTRDSLIQAVREAGYRVAPAHGKEVPGHDTG